MRTPKALLVLGAVLSCGIILAQSDFPPHWSPVVHSFHIDGMPHSAKIEHSAILATKPWDPSKPLPLSLGEVEQVARKELRKLVSNDKSWEVVGFDITRLETLPNTPNWYYTVHFRSTVPRGGSITNGFDYAPVLVDFGGKAGFFDNN